MWWYAMRGNMALILAFMGLLGCGTARMMSPEELAVYTNCDPEKIAYWIDNRIEYHEQGAYWLPAGASMTLERGDCKAKATIARDTLNRCVGYEAWVKVIKNGERYHAVSMFTDNKGRKGFMDSGIIKLYPASTPWSFIVLEIPGGPWTDI